MKFEIDVSDDMIRNMVTKATSLSLEADWRGQPQGDLAKEIASIVKETMREAVSQLPIRQMVDESVALHIVPTVKEEIQRQIKAEAKRAVKETLAEKM